MTKVIIKIILFFETSVQVILWVNFSKLPWKKEREEVMEAF